MSVQPAAIELLQHRDGDAERRKDHDVVGSRLDVAVAEELDAHARAAAR